MSIGFLRREGVRKQRLQKESVEASEIKELEKRKERAMALFLDLDRSFDWAAARNTNPRLNNEHQEFVAYGWPNNGKQHSILLAEVQRQPDPEDGRRHFTLGRDTWCQFDITNGEKVNSHGESNIGKELHAFTHYGLDGDIHWPIAEVGSYREAIIEKIENFHIDGQDKKVRREPRGKAVKSSFEMDDKEFQDLRIEMLVDDIERLINFEVQKFNNKSDRKLLIEADSHNKEVHSLRIIYGEVPVEVKPDNFDYVGQGIKASILIDSRLGEPKIIINSSQGKKEFNLNDKHDDLKSALQQVIEEINFVKEGEIEVKDAKRQAKKDFRRERRDQRSRENDPWQQERKRDEVVKDEVEKSLKWIKLGVYSDRDDDLFKEGVEGKPEEYAALLKEGYLLLTTLEITALANRTSQSKLDAKDIPEKIDRRIFEMAMALRYMRHKFYSGNKAEVIARKIGNDLDENVEYYDRLRRLENKDLGYPSARGIYSKENRTENIALALRGKAIEMLLTGREIELVVDYLVESARIQKIDPDKFLKQQDLLDYLFRAAKKSREFTGRNIIGRKSDDEIRSEVLAAIDKKLAEK